MNKEMQGSQYSRYSRDIRYTVSGEGHELLVNVRVTRISVLEELEDWKLKPFPSLVLCAKESPRERSGILLVCACQYYYYYLMYTLEKATPAIDIE